MIKSTTVNPANIKFNCLVYGDPGAGKTKFCGDAIFHEKLNKVLFLNFEGGLLTIAGSGKIEEIKITSTEQVDSILKDFIERDPSTVGYNTVVVDSGSELQTLALDEQVQERGEKLAATRAGYIHDKNEIQRNDYGKATNQLKKIFRRLRDMPVNVIMTALPKSEYGPPIKGSGSDTGPIIEVAPNFTRALRIATIGYFDFVWYMYKDDSTDSPSFGKHCMITADVNVTKAKTRGMLFSKALGLNVVDPYLPDIYDLIIATEGAAFNANIATQVSDGGEKKSFFIVPPTIMDNKIVEEVPQIMSLSEIPNTLAEAETKSTFFSVVKE